MDQFSGELREQFERLELPLAFCHEKEEGPELLLVSDGLCALLGIKRGQAIGAIVERIHPEDVGVIGRARAGFRNGKNQYDVVHRIRYADGSYHQVHSVASPWPVTGGQRVTLVLYLDLYKWGKEVRKLTVEYELFKQDHFYTDPLTGLPNINYLNQYADQRVTAIRDGGGEPVLVYTDVQAMQSYNNQYGFSGGNALMCLIAEELKAAFPEGLVMRGADDHFVVVDAFTDEDELRERLRRTNDTIRKRAYGNTSGIQAGVCLVGKEASAAETVDKAKQAVKQIRLDLNRVVSFYTAGDDEDYWKQRYIVENFDRAMENGWIKVFYHCIARTETGKVAALEALARWNDPVRGTISPGDFVPVLRRFHQLYKLDLYMAEQVCRETVIRAENGFPPVPVSVNFTAQDFDYVDIPAAVSELYERYGLSRYIGKDCCVIEITEQDIASATDRFREQLRQLKADGYQLWLDDFGSGYSALSMFSRFDFDLIKFDMDLLRHLDDNNGVNRRIIRAMTGVAREMGIHTLAEGMETEEQRQFLLECGCELAQGFLYHKPEPLDSFIYKAQMGHKHRLAETPEERKSYL